MNPAMPALRPNLYFAFQQNLVFLVNLFANDLDQLVNILAARTLVGDDEVGVLGAYFRAADLQALESRLIDQSAGAEAARILEDASGVLAVERLGIFFVHPDHFNFLLV